jgi:hypothetical protein
MIQRLEKTLSRPTENMEESKEPAYDEEKDQPASPVTPSFKSRFRATRTKKQSPFSARKTLFGGKQSQRGKQSKQSGQGKRYTCKKKDNVPMKAKAKKGKSFKASIQRSTRIWKKTRGNKKRT